ncbi:hypothetical protein Tco_0715225 [Tanacetum coccineum]
MSTSTHPIIVLSDSYIEDAFSSMNTPNYTPASFDYFPASPGNTSSDPSIRCIQSVGTAYWGFLGVLAFLDMAYRILFPWSLVSADTDTPYLP